MSSVRSLREKGLAGHAKPFEREVGIVEDLGLATAMGEGGGIGACEAGRAENDQFATEPPCPGASELEADKEAGKARPRVIRVVAGMVLREGRVLLARRGPTMTLAGCWEFPGGKLEAGEGPAEALVRELDEELGIRVRCVAELAVSETQQGDRHIRLEGWLAELLAGEPEAREHDALLWQTPDAVDEAGLAPADVPLLRALRAHVVGRRTR